MKNIKSLISILALSVVLATVAGCAETSKVEATGKGTIRGINAIVTSPEAIFRIEEVIVGTASFKQAAGFSPYDDLSYNFNFDVIIPGETDAVRLASQFVDVIADTEYTLVLGGSIAAPTITMWEEPERDWTEGETVYEVDFVHLSPTLGEVDLYFLPFGTVPAQGLAIATLNYGDRVPYQEYPQGGRDIFITLKDDPDNYLYQSPTVPPTPGARTTFAIFQPDPTLTANIAVNLIDSSGGSSNLPDIGSKPVFRLLHAAFGTTNVNGYLNNDFGTIVFENVGFGEISAYVELDPVIGPFTLTDTLNSGAPVHEEEVSIGGNSIHTIYFSGEPGALSYLDFPDSGRPLETSPQVRLTNVSVNAGTVDIYLLEPGTVIEVGTPIQFNSLPTLLSTGFFGPIAGNYEITITNSGDSVPIAPPVTFDLANGDIVDIAIMDTADPAVMNLFVITSTLP
jgi:hypothetical protein